MASKKMSLKVIKADGSKEPYYHTKVVGSISNALVTAGQADIKSAEDLAEAVTYYISREKRARSITSGEIFSIVQAVLAGTDHEAAAAAFSERHYQRKLRRCRIEVISAKLRGLKDAAKMRSAVAAGQRSQWDKSRIVSDLVVGQEMDRQAARMVAAMVEEKVFGMQMTQVTTSLIDQLVLGDTAAVLHAESQLQLV